MSAQSEISVLKSQIMQREATQHQSTTFISFEQSEVQALNIRLHDEEEMASSNKGQYDELFSSTRLSSDRPLTEANARYSQLRADSDRRYANIEAEASQFKQALLAQ